ncbi:MAG: hypothetical protein U0236_03075 [Nitrospira sp.]
MTIEENKMDNEAAIRELIGRFANAFRAFSHCLHRVKGTLKNGRQTDRWLRWTACYRKTNGKWLIVQDQVSVPGD